MEANIRAELEDLTGNWLHQTQNRYPAAVWHQKADLDFTATQQEIVAEKDKDWLWNDWEKPVPCGTPPPSALVNF